MTPVADRLFEVAFQKSTTPTIIVRANPPEFTIIASNEQHKIATNYVGQNIVGKSLTEVFTPEDENRKNEFDVLLDGLMETISSKRVTRLPVFRYDMPGTAVSTFQESWWQLEITPILGEDNKVEYLMTTTHNITGEVISKNIGRFRELLNAIPHIAWTNTVHGTVNFYNRQWYKYTGLSEQDSPKFQWRQVLHPDELDEKIQHYRTILKSRHAGEFELRKKASDGTYRWHLVRIVPMLDESGRIKDWIGTATDIHDLKLLQQRKDDFITIASHELKTPITILKASVQLLNRMKDNLSSETLGRIVEQANKGIDRVNVLITNLLDVSKFNQGQVHLNKKLISIAEVLDQCCGHVALKEGFDIQIEGEKDLQLYADPERIDQVMANLIGNAMKYAGDKKIIRVNVEKADDMAKVSVTDFGIGISPEKIPYLFDRYYRVDEQGLQYSGIGLGLYICAEIIKKHGGRIGAESEVGKGSTFWFTIPLVA